jgi:20S proteasome subunit alpha 6
MNRNMYDGDTTTWSPQGRIHQIEYAMEAVKQGSASVGVKNKTHAVLACIQRSASELSGYQRKVFDLDEHVGVAVSGLTSDARSLCRFLRGECSSERWAFDQPLQVSRLISRVSDKLQKCTQLWSRRPYGVGLLVAGHDKTGPHIYQVDPSANTFDCKAMGIGARSQSAKTYLERNLDAILASGSVEELVRHALLALRDCLPSETELTAANCCVAVVGPDMKFTIYTEDAVTPFVALMEEPAQADDVEMGEEGGDAPAA